MRSAPSRVDTDVVLRSLSYPVRRLVVAELRAADRAVPIDRLVEECRTSDPAVLDATPHHPHVSLQHVHLPVLATAGLVRYDREESEVRLADRAHANVDRAIDELERLRCPPHGVASRRAAAGRIGADQIAPGQSVTVTWSVTCR